MKKKKKGEKGPGDPCSSALSLGGKGLTQVQRGRRKRIAFCTPEKPLSPARPWGRKKKKVASRCSAVKIGDASARKKERGGVLYHKGEGGKKKTVSWGPKPGGPFGVLERGAIGQDGKREEGGAASN